MKNLILLLLLLSGSAYLYSINTEDSISRSSTIDILEKKNYILKNTNDSLFNQQIIYKAKEDYYVCAISDQATKYSLITASLLVLLALISYATFKYELISLNKKIKEDINKHKREDEIVRENLLIGLARSYVNGGNCCQIIAMHYEENNEWLEAVYYNLFAAYNHYLASDEFLKIEGNENKRNSHNELELASRFLRAIDSLIKNISEEKQFTISQASDYRKWLDSIATLKDPEMKDLVARIRTKLVDRTEKK